MESHILASWRARAGRVRRDGGAATCRRRYEYTATCHGQDDAAVRKWDQQRNCPAPPATMPPPDEQERAVSRQPSSNAWKMPSCRSCQVRATVNGSAPVSAEAPAWRGFDASP